MNNNGLYFTCKVGDLAEETFAVYKFTLEEALSDLYTLELYVAAKDANIDLAAQICKQANFSVWSGGEAQRTISGVVEGIELGKSGFRRTMYKIIIRPQAWLLTLRKDSRIFHFKSIPQIVESMFQFHNVQFEKQLADEHAVREYVTQKRETDYQFLQRLTAEEGMTFWFEQKDEENAQIFYADSRLGQKAGISLTYNTHPQSAEAGDLMSDVRFAVYMRSNQAIHKDRNYLKPAYELKHKSVAEGADDSDDRFTVFESFGRFADDSPGKPFTQYRLDALQSESELGSATTNCVKLMPGKIFSLAEHPDAKMNADWQVIRIRHEGSCPQALEEESDQGPTFVTNEVEFISSQKEWRPPFIHKPVPDSNEIAEVVGPSGEEIHTNEHGCVKVHFHWNRYDAPDDKASAWVRVSNQWAGAGYGSVTLPRIGHEVMITYIDGDIDRPIVSGRHYNNVNKPPYALPANKTKMVWRSKSHKSEGFNELSFEDESGKEEIYIHGQKDFNSLINNDASWDIRNDHNAKIGNNSTWDITGTHDITVTGATRIKADGGKSESIEGESNLKVGGAYVIKTGDEVSIEAGAKITLAAGTELTIKAGSQFISLKPSGIFTSTPFNIGSGSPGTGKGLNLKMPGLLGLLAAPTLIQQATLSKSAPYCEECEKCKNGECDLPDAPATDDKSEMLKGMIAGGGFGGGIGAGMGAMGTSGFAGGLGGMGGMPDLGFGGGSPMDMASGFMNDSGLSSGINMVQEKLAQAQGMVDGAKNYAGNMMNEAMGSVTGFAGNVSAGASSSLGNMAGSTGGFAGGIAGGVNPTGIAGNIGGKAADMAKNKVTGIASDAITKKFTL